jgi:serine/threonine-protein kinase
MELNPLSASDCARSAYLHYVKGEYAFAADHLGRAFELDTDYGEARFYQGLLHFQQEQYESVADRLSASHTTLDIGLVAAAHARLGRMAAASGCMEKLRQLAERQFVTPLGEGLAAIAMGDFDVAFQRLSEAIGHRTNFVNLLAVEPFFNPLRKDSRFPRLLEKLNLIERARTVS